MSNEKPILPDADFLIGATAAWCLCAVVMLCMTALIAATTGLGEQVLDYLSSINSFFCASAAGAAAINRSRMSRMLTALVTGTALVILLLTVGFLIRGKEMDPSSILSVVSFTYAGVLTGTVFRLKSARRRSQYLFRKRN